MIEVKRNDIVRIENGFQFNCTGCKTKNIVSTKAYAIIAISRGNCKSCAVHYKHIIDSDTVKSLGLYQNEKGKWCSNCPSCGEEQAYTRKDHAKQSAKVGKNCRKCASYNNKTRPSVYEGFLLVNIDVFRKNAIGRGLAWEIDEFDVFSLWESQKGLCALSGLPMQKNPKTWSIDRIDNDRGYTKDNIHLVLTYVNMMKGKYSIKQFIETAKAIADHNP